MRSSASPLAQVLALCVSVFVPNPDRFPLGARLFVFAAEKQLHQLQADGELPLDELLRRYGYATNQNNDEDEDDDRSSEMDSEVRSSSAVSGTTAGAPAASIAALESEKEQKGAGLGSAGKGIGNSGEEGKLESGSDGGRGEQEDGDSGQEEMDEGGGEASDNGESSFFLNNKKVPFGCVARCLRHTVLLRFCFSLATGTNVRGCVVVLPACLNLS